MPRLPSALLACLLVTSLHAADWPQWRGPTRDGRWPEKGLPARLPDETAGPLEGAHRRRLRRHRRRRRARLRHGPRHGAEGGRARRLPRRGIGQGRVDALLRRDLRQARLRQRPALDADGPRRQGLHVRRAGAPPLPRREDGQGRLGPGHRQGLPRQGADLGALVFAARRGQDPHRPGRRHAGRGPRRPRPRHRQGGLAQPSTTGPATPPPSSSRSGKRRQLVYFTPQHVVGLDPATGKRLWQRPLRGHRIRRVDHGRRPGRRRLARVELLVGQQGHPPRRRGEESRSRLGGQGVEPAHVHAAGPG